MVPKSLAGWTLDSVKALLESRYLEMESFDWKSMLPVPADEEGKRRLRVACAAFANSEGGFLIFGIADDTRLPPEQRLIGLQANLDFPERFGSFPSLCSPTVKWQFLNPPIRLRSGNCLHVIEIPKSYLAPHCVGTPDEGLRFPKRTNKGTEYMSYEEVRMSFLGYYDKRLRLRLLDAELLAIAEDAGRARIDKPEDQKSKYSLFTIETRIVESVIAETYMLTADHPDLLHALQRLRKAVNVANNKTSVFFTKVALPLGGMEEIYLVRFHFTSSAL